MPYQKPHLWSGSSNAGVYTFDAAYRKHYHRTGALRRKRAFDDAYAYDNWRGKPEKYCESFFRPLLKRSNTTILNTGYIRHACHVYFLRSNLTMSRPLPLTRLRRARLQRGWKKVAVRSDPRYKFPCTGHPTIRLRRAAVPMHSWERIAIDAVTRLNLMAVVPANRMDHEFLHGPIRLIHVKSIETPGFVRYACLIWSLPVLVPSAGKGMLARRKHLQGNNSRRRTMAIGK
jgi:hypothetical protein